MDNLPVTLIVKAPNQQIEDQTIKCELSWTINKLKQHLSEVYPSRPPKHEQKLIYSGQLLNDSVVLKDVLRQYDGQETHTVHLVCTTRQSAPKKQTAAPPKPQPTMPNVSTSTAQVPSSTASNADQRVPAPNMPWLNAPPIDPQQYALQMAWMQQAYLQYLTHYMNLAANTADGVQIPQIPLNQPNDLAQAVGARRDDLGAAAPAVDPAAAPPQQLAPPQRDPENPERDWLDLFYIFSRVIVLFSVVYFYSSPLRFIFVLFLGFGLYLYQIGFFRNINYNNNNNNNNVPPEPVAQETQAPSRLMVVWTFFTTFFASLIPEIPNAV